MRSGAAGRVRFADAAMRGEYGYRAHLIARRVSQRAQNDGARRDWAEFRKQPRTAEILCRLVRIQAANREGATPLWIAL